MNASIQRMAQANLSSHVVQLSDFTLLGMDSAFGDLQDSISVARLCVCVELMRGNEPHHSVLVSHPVFSVEMNAYRNRTPKCEKEFASQRLI